MTPDSPKQYQQRRGASRRSRLHTKDGTRPRVTILGGGFAGLACANTLDSRHFAVTLVDRKADFEFLPNIHELVSGVKKPGQLRLPLEDAMATRGHRFLKADVSAVDPVTKQLRAGRRTIEADYLVIALGSADADFGVSGVTQHSLPFKSVAQCDAIRRRLVRITRENVRPRVTIIGSGLEGVEAVGETLRRYGDQSLHITLVEARESLLPGGPLAVGQHIQSHCEAMGVECVTGDAVSRITARTVLLESGRRLRSDATVWTGGPAPPPLLQHSGLAEPGCWVSVDRYLQHREYADVFVAGDAAALDTPISKQAYHALDMGHCVAMNLQRKRRGKRLRRYRPSPKPTLLAFGDLDTVLITDRISVAGPSLAAGKEAVFAAVMAQLDRRGTPERLGAAVERASDAGRELLWPRLKSWDKLRQQTRLQRLA